VKAKKSGGSSDDGSYRDVSPAPDTLTRSASGSTPDSNKYRANARAKLPSLFNPFGKVTDYRRHHRRHQSAISRPT